MREEMKNTKKAVTSDASDVIVWERDGAYKNLMTGIKSKTLSKVIRNSNNIFYSDRDCFTRTSILSGYEAKYNQRSHAVEIYKCFIDLWCDEPQEWERGSLICVLTKDGKVFEDKKMTVPYRGINLPEIDIHENWIIKDGATGEDIYNGEKITSCEYTVNIMKKIYGNGICLGDDNCNMLATMKPSFPTIQFARPNEENFSKALQYVEEKLKPVNKAVLKKMFPICKTDRTIQAYSVYMGNNKTTKFAYVEKITNGHVVVRFFAMCACGDGFDTEEFARIYIKGFEKPVVCEKYFDKWFVKAESFWDFESFLFPWDKETVKGTTLENLNQFTEFLTIDDAEKVITEYNTFLGNWDTFYTRTSDSIIRLFVNPYTNDIFSSKMENVKKLIKKSSIQNANIDSVITKVFNIAETEDIYAGWNRSVLRDGNMQKHMLETLDAVLAKMFDDMDNEKNQMKKDKLISIGQNLFCHVSNFFRSCPDNYLKNMNKEQFSEVMFATYESIANDMFYDSKDRRLVAIEKLVAIKGARNILGYIGYVYGELTNMCNEGLDSSDIYLFSHRLNTYFDYVKMVDYLRDTENRIHRPEWKFKSLDEIEQAHNSVLTVYNLTHNVRDYQEKQEKFEKLWTKERYDKFQYFGKEFSVIAPKDVLEIANEGSLLHHCAKSYIDDVINDVTNILFVRRNENLARAFYTLEIQENAVRQCHGFGNCNIDREKGLEAFLMEYCEKKGFEYKNPDLVLAAV